MRLRGIPLKLALWVGPILYKLYMNSTRFGICSNEDITFWQQSGTRMPSLDLLPSAAVVFLRCRA